MGPGEAPIHGGSEGGSRERELEVRDRILLVAACVVILAGGVCLGVGPFTGSWTVEVGLAPQQTSVFSTFSSTLDVGFRLGFLELSSISDFIFSGWLWQEFGMDAAVGCVSFDGMMLFEPQTGSFLYAQGVLAFDLNPVVITLYTAMVGPSHPGGLNWGSVFDIYGELLGGDISVESATLLGADLDGISFTKTSSYGPSPLLTKTYVTDPTIDGPWASFSGEVATFKALAFGCIGFTSVSTFSELGFESQVFQLAFVHLFGIPLDITLDYFFSLQTASRTFTPSLESDFGCLKVYSDVLGSGGTITGVAIYGIEFKATVAGSTFRSISNLDTTTYVITQPEYGLIIEEKSEADAEGHLYYPQSYWEVISLTTEVPTAGGTTFSFTVDTFYGTATGLLFDWAMSEMGATIAFGQLFSVTTGIVVDATGFIEWSVAITFCW
jgi:hypothetical protein